MVPLTVIRCVLMNETSIKSTIVDQWLNLPEYLRRTDKDAAGFVLKLMVNNPDLIKIDGPQPLKVIKGWLCEHLPEKQAGYQ